MSAHLRFEIPEERAAKRRNPTHIGICSSDRLVANIFTSQMDQMEKGGRVGLTEAFSDRTSRDTMDEEKVSHVFASLVSSLKRNSHVTFKEFPDMFRVIWNLACNSSVCQQTASPNQVIKQAIGDIGYIAHLHFASGCSRLDHLATNPLPNRLRQKHHTGCAVGNRPTPVRCQHCSYDG